MRSQASSRVSPPVSAMPGAASVSPLSSDAAAPAETGAPTAFSNSSGNSASNLASALADNAADNAGSISASSAADTSANNARRNLAPNPGSNASSLFATMLASRLVLRRALPEWWPVWLGLVLLFLPTFVDLFNGPWIGEEQAHGPMIFALALWLLYRKWPGAAPPSAAGSPGGWAVLACGLGLYLLGRSQHILMFEIGAIIAVLASVVLVKRGGAALRVLWFPFFFMLFMVPLPSELVAAVTMPMKMAVSWATEELLFAVGYPIARSGVVLQVGQYQLLVADACAGLQTLLTLEALGLFYLNLMRHPSAFRNIGLALLIIPISFSANVIRVVVLTLVTYYWGDAAGQGFLHGFAGMVLFLTALALIIAVDTGLQWMARRRTAAARGEGA